MGAYLLDTHALLWWMGDPAQLSDEARGVIADPAHTIMLSAASAWEMSIKQRLGRLEFPPNLEEVLGNDRIEMLPITITHALGVGMLPMHHQDPFDRMLIAQAKHEQLILITRDRQIQQYDVQTLRA
ncbi:MAG: PIN domain nuclease [Phycisphaerae bacterium]|nr:PIN domain nuclease [Phycisphaerae bacterium]MBM92395.1 PIN domain nuclease [Phycisphaerae bacterium]HCT43823.1 PIN domain nuclease [Phycisphaerales bacterium]|tara:strand:+ start:360 stop:740 length:381 start_codon:yes stop_codon:yes gene_type:complete